MLAAIRGLSGLILDEEAVFLWKCHFALMKLMSRIDELRLLKACAQLGFDSFMFSFCVFFICRLLTSALTFLFF